MSQSLQRIQDMLSKCGFLKTGCINVFENLSFGPLAILLADNIRREWLNTNLMSSDFNTFLYDSHIAKFWHEDCQTSYSHALQNNEQLPFGLVSVSANPPSIQNEKSSTACADSSSKTNVYRRLSFMSQKDCQKYFYRLQRQRKFWWRKFSTDPERFNIVEVKSDESEETVQITAKFPWTTNVVETISYHGTRPLIPYGNLFEVKVGRKKVLPHVIESVCLESSALMTYLYDAHQQLPTRTMLRLHRSLAPYKAAVVVDSPGDKLDDLNQLVKFVSLNLRQAGLHTLQSTSTPSRDSQLSSHDSMGVLYTVMVRPNALVNGIVGLRSRDTTLEEEVHVSNLTSHLQQLVIK